MTSRRLADAVIALDAYRDRKAAEESFDLFFTLNQYPRGLRPSTSRPAG
jgi:hypothetical protein